MSMKVWLAAACVVLAGSQISVAFADEAKETGMSLPVKKGQINSIGNLNSKTLDDCTASVGSPQLMLLKLPTNGRFEIGLMQTAVPNNSEVAAKCTGKQVPAVGMFYVPNDGFVGEDSVEFQFTGQGGAKFLLKLNVQ
jgi:hypothetical protein